MTLIVIRETVPEKTWAAAFPGGDKLNWLSQTCLISPRQAIFGILSSAEKPAWNAWRILKWRQKKQPFWKILSAVITAALALFLNVWHQMGNQLSNIIIIHCHYYLKCIILSWRSSCDEDHAILDLQESN